MHMHTRLRAFRQTVAGGATMLPNGVVVASGRRPSEGGADTAVGLFIQTGIRSLSGRRSRCACRVLRDCCGRF